MGSLTGLQVKQLTWLKILEDSPERGSSGPLDSHFKQPE